MGVYLWKGYRTAVSLMNGFDLSLNCFNLVSVGDFARGGRERGLAMLPWGIEVTPVSVLVMSVLARNH